MGRLRTRLSALLSPALLLAQSYTVYPLVDGPAGDANFQPAIQAQLWQPLRVRKDAAGNIYVWNVGSPQTVRVIRPDGTIAPCANYCGFVRTLPDRTVVHILAEDRAGNVYTARPDTTSPFHTAEIWRIAPDGSRKKIAGTGEWGASGDGGQATAAQIVAKFAAVGQDGSVYFASDVVNRIRKVAPDGTISTVLDGVQTPFGLAVDEAGNLYFADLRSVRRLAPDGTLTTVVTRRGEHFGPDAWGLWRGDGGPAEYASVGGPAGLYRDRDGTLYIAEYSGFLSRIRPDGIFETIAGVGAGRGDGGPAQWAGAGDAYGIALDAAGNVYYSDHDRNQVNRIAPDGLLTPIAGDGLCRFAGDGGPAHQASLCRPSGLALDRAGNLYVAEMGNHRIRRITPSGLITTVAGKGWYSFGGDGGPATQASLALPSGVAAGPDGSLYISDCDNHRIRRVTPAGIIETVAGTGEPGFAGDGGPARNARMTNPKGIVVDALGSLYFADPSVFRVRKIAPDGTITTVAGGGPERFPYGDGGPATAAFVMPLGLAFDTNGDLLVGDLGRRRILRIDSAGVISTLETGSAVITGLAPDALGDIYFAGGGVWVASKQAPPEPLPVIFPPQHWSTRNYDPVAPGLLVRIRGARIGPEREVGAVANAEGMLPYELAGVRALFDDIPGPLVSVRQDMVTAIVPNAVAGRARVNVELEYRGRRSNPVAMPAQDAVPAVSTFPNTAERGGVMSFWVVGAGLMDGAPEGRIAVPPLAPIRLPVHATIDGRTAELLYAGAAPGLAATAQANVRIPTDLAPGLYPLRLFFGPYWCEAFVTVR